MKVVVVDYGSGNLQSAARATERAALDAGLAVSVQISGAPGVVAAADRIILPGQGAFADCRAGLMAVPGLFDAITEGVVVKGRPFLGICVGMQLMAREGREFGIHPGFGWIDGVCEAMVPATPGLKIPHMGWNDLTVTQPEHPVMRGVVTGDHVYFVHSYHLTGVPADQVLATADYGGPVVAVVGRDNRIGTQFHVEKSQRAGLTMLANFLRWAP